MTTDFKQYIDMLSAAKIKYAQLDHGNGRSTLIIEQGAQGYAIHVDFERGRLTCMQVCST